MILGLIIRTNTGHIIIIRLPLQLTHIDTPYCAYLNVAKSPHWKLMAQIIYGYVGSFGNDCDTKSVFSLKCQKMTWEA